MRRSESQEHLTTSQTQETPSREAGERPEVEFRGERRPVRQPDQESSSSNQMPFDPDLLLVHGCRQIISLFVPVSLCMVFVVIVCCTVSSYSSDNTTFRMAMSELGGGDTTEEPGPKEGLIMALTAIAFIILATCVIVLCFKFRCMKFIKGYMFVAGFFICFLLSSFFFMAICDSMRVFVDYITFVFFIWNFGVIGMFSFFWKTPLLVQQAYLIFIAAQIALLLTLVFPWWATWFLLGFLAIWDLFAVLCPQGPLNILVKLVQESNEPFPAIMVYSTAAGIVYTVDGPQPPTSSNDSNQAQNNAAAPEQPHTQEHTQEHSQEQGQERTTAVSADDDDGGFRTHVQNTQRAERLMVMQQNDPDFTASGRARSAMSALNNSANDEPDEPQVQISNTSRNLREIQQEVLSREDRGIKLGMGDFIFYSLLIAKASQSRDWGTILAVFVAILIGMCSTLLLLAIRGHALPALPISIFFGLVFYFCTNLIITPFSSSLATSQAFI